VRVLLTAIGLTGAIAKVWGFLFKDRDPLGGVTGRQVLEILREYQALQGPPEGAEAIGDPAPSDGSGVRISILVEHDDDSRSVLIVEMRG